MTSQTALTDNELMAIAPSIFAPAAHERMSSRYAFISTIDVVNKMRQEGFMPFSAAQSKSRTPGGHAFTKHLIRFRDQSATVTYENLGGLYPEVVFMNGHDGSSAYRLNCGVFRAICVNGLVAGDSYSQMKVRHTGSVDDILNATFEMVGEFPKLMAAAEGFSQLQLTAPQQEAFASAALDLRYDAETKPSPVTPAQILKPRRSADAGKDLFSTFNVIQEHMIQGGVQGRNPATKRRQKIRAVTAIGDNVKLNRSLWTLTERMAELLRA
jgi:hypothetical protein